MLLFKNMCFHFFFNSSHMVVCKIALYKGQFSLTIEFVHFFQPKTIFNALNLTAWDKLHNNDPKATAYDILHL